MNADVSNLEQRIRAIEERNERVENEKAWEVSSCRKVSILGLTYLVMSVLFWSLEKRDFLVQAIVPALGFGLSTLSLSVVKGWWLRR